MDTTINVQHSKHFKIDPAKLNIGDIQLPDPIMKTTVVGDENYQQKDTPQRSIHRGRAGRT